MQTPEYTAHMAAVHFLVESHKQVRNLYDVGRLMYVSPVSTIEPEGGSIIKIFYRKEVDTDALPYVKCGLKFQYQEKIGLAFNRFLYGRPIQYTYACTLLFSNFDYYRWCNAYPDYLGRVTLKEIIGLKELLSENYPENCHQWCDYLRIGETKDGNKQQDNY